MISKIWKWATAIAVIAMGVFRIKLETERKDRAEDRADNAERGLNRAKERQTIDDRIRRADDGERRRLRNKWTRRR